MKTKIQIKSIFGKLLFEYETENNSITKTVEQAAKVGANLVDANLVDANLVDANLVDAYLRGAYLRGANLVGAYLVGAYLRGANLEGANLVDANLVDANLVGANLVDANLEGANLEGAYLRGAYLRGANLVGAIKLPIYCRWSIGITDNLIHIGCEKRSIEDWDKFFASNEVLSTKRDTPVFKQIQACYEAYKAYYLALQRPTNKTK